MNIFVPRALSIFAVGTTLCLRDSTRTDFHMASFDISTLLGTSSFLAASTGIVQQTVDKMDGKKIRESKRLCPIVKKVNPARNTEIFFL